MKSFEDAELRAAIDSGLTNTEIAEQFGVHVRTVQKRKLRLDQQVVSGYSTLYRTDRHGQKVLEWVKTKADANEILRAIERVVEDHAKKLPKAKPAKAVKVSNECITVYPLGDPHVGLLTWHEETGDDWDCSIAPKIFDQVFGDVLSRTMPSKTAIIANMGDYFHADNIMGVTSRSGNRLDLDGRPDKWIRVGLDIACRFIDTALVKHQKVIWMNVTGNHDDILGLFLGRALERIYSGEKRVEIVTGSNPYKFLRFGKVLLGFAHGHLCKPEKLPAIMSDLASEDWGRTTFRHWYMGHVHHSSFKEYSGASVETVGVVVPADAYARGAGYSHQRAFQAVTYDPNLGEIRRDRHNVVG